jgi:hypothetical protein
MLLTAFPNSFGVADAIAFDAVNLSTTNTWDILTKINKSVIIHGFEFEKALEHALQLCPTFGKHSGVIHFTPQSVTAYKWAHKVYQPWGTKLPLQCPQCGVLNSWSSVSLQNAGYVGYGIECKNDCCGKTGSGNPKEPHSFTVRQPVNSTMLSMNKGAGWLKIVI